MKKDSKENKQSFGKSYLRLESYKRNTTEENMNMLRLKQTVDGQIELDGMDMC